MRQEKVIFTNRNNQKIAAHIDLPVDQAPKAYVLFAHCFTCGKDLLAIKNISRGLTSNGLAVLRFDFTGLGQSEGAFEDTNFTTNISDLVEAASFMKEQFEAPKLLIGHSLGGAAVIMAASKIESVQAVATIGAPSSPDHVSHLLGEQIDEIKSEGSAEVNIGGRAFQVKKSFLDDINAFSMKEVIKNLRKPILILHSPQDQIVGIKNAQEIYAAAMHPKSFISLDGADHLLSKKEDSHYSGNVIANWTIRYLNLPEKKKLKTKHQVLAQLGDEGYTTDILSGKHHLRADEPEDVGGNDFGPAPYDFLLAGLGACTAMTLRMYANHKKWDLQEVEVHLNHQKDHKEDSDHPEKKSSKIDKIERNIHLKGQLDEKQRQRLLEIANKCPVHKTLHGEVEIHSKLKED